MNKTEAVNALLAKIRQRSVQSVEEPLNGDARAALETLDKTSRQVQLRGWSYNTDVNYTVPLDSNNHAVLPENTLRATPKERHRVNGLLPVQRGDKLYNRATNSYTFDSPVELEDLVIQLDWDALPPVAQNHITAAAAVELIHKTYGDNEAYRVAQRDESHALLEARRAYNQAERVNLLDGPDTSRIRNRRRSGR